MINCNKINVKNGTTGEEVKEIQKYLKYYGYYTGIIDGKCGQLTTNSIKSFQQQKKLVVDGVFGPITCKTSNINGADISLTNQTISLKQWQDMNSRYDNYTKNNKKEPLIIYINKEYPYDYVTLSKFKEMKQRYDQYIKENNIEPQFIYINKTTITSTSNKESSTITKTISNSNYTIFTNTHVCERKGGNCLGQITSYHCGPHALKQALRRLGITKYTEQQIGSYAGTTTSGTSHLGLETAIAHIAKLEGIKLNVEWKNFSDLGQTLKERFKKYGDLMTDNDKTVFHHEKYRNKYGHYSLFKNINTNSNLGIIANSLGDKCGGSSFCGYMETRDFNTQLSYFNRISQKSICIITKM